MYDDVTPKYASIKMNNKGDVAKRVITLSERLH